MEKTYTIKIEEKTLKEIEKETGLNLLEKLKEKGAIIQEHTPSKKQRFLILNKGAHPIEQAIKQQFPESDIEVLSEGNLEFEEIDKIALKAAKEYRKGDVLVLTGPGLLVALATIYIHAKSPDEIKLAQYDLKEKVYRILTLNHLDIRRKLSEK